MSAMERSNLDAHQLRSMMSDALDRQSSLLQSILKLARSQTKLIEAKQHDALLSLVHERQSLIESLVTIRADLLGWAAEIRSRSSELSMEERRSLQLKIDETRDLSSQVLEIDTQDLDRIMEAHVNSKSKIIDMHDVMNARKGYQSTVHSSPQFADARG